MEKPVCRHCGCKPVSRPRGLCWQCYYTPEVARLYPSTSKHRQRNYGDFMGRTPLPAQATSALPGTSEKVAVLEARAEAHVALWHPRDAKIDTEKKESQYPNKRQGFRH